MVALPKEGDMDMKMPTFCFQNPCGGGLVAKVMFDPCDPCGL